jgi:DNA mismatch repair protein MutS2
LREERRLCDLTELRLRQKELELKQGAIGKLRLLLDESRKTLENLVREVREGELSQDKTRKVKEFLESLARTVQAEDEALDEEDRAVTELRREKQAEPEGGFAPGMEVLIGERRTRGTIVRLDKKTPLGNTWLVETGALKISFPEKDLSQAEKKSPPAAGWAAEISSQADVRVELNLRGMRLEDALLALRRQIDGAVIAGLKEFSVVHGKGDGILQKGVHEYLKGESAVADYYFSRPEMGGFGRTEVILLSRT